MASSPVSRRQVRETLFALAGVAFDPSSEPESEDEQDEQDEPIVVEALLVSALHGGLRNSPPFDRCFRMPYDVLTRSDRLVAASHLCVEIAQSEQFVFHCFHCQKFILGYLCYHHHIRTCLNAEIAPIAQWVALRERRFDAPPSWRWVDCDYCIRQEVLATRYHKIRYVSAVMHWARFWTGLFLRKIRHIPLRCSATLHRHLTCNSEDSESYVIEPLQFFFIDLGFPPHVASAICVFFE